MIEVRDVTFCYPGDTEPTLHALDAQVSAGEVVGIVGPNGSGKSTLGRLLKGLLLPTDGAVVVDGVNSRVDSLGVRKLVGLVFQNPDSQIVNAVVEDEVAFGPENLGLPTAEVRQRVDQALQSVGLAGSEVAECHALAMGDKQRVALAAVLAMQPQYLVLDEPTAWLEAAARWQLIEEMMRWKSATDGGVVLITHRMDEARLCDRLYGLLDGRVIASGPPADLLEDDEVRSRLALEVPETYALASELRSAGLPVDPGVSIERLAEALWQS
jgi:energy-coupling factor transport system ATP-binding protein